MTETMTIPQDLQKLLQSARQQRQTIVLVTGVFDILHQEHKQFLINAKQAGDVLIVGIESDMRVRQIKGEGRPINSASTRKKRLAELVLADYIFVLPEQFSSPADHRALIDQIRPQVLAVSSHTPHLEKKRALVHEYGGDVQIVHQHNPAVSTTQILASQKESS